MDDLSRITEHIDSRKKGEVISDACARLIAAHCMRSLNGRWSNENAPIAVLATTGAVVDGIEYTLRQRGGVIADGPLKPLVALGALPDYLNTRRYAGRTGPVDGWADLTL